MFEVGKLTGRVASWSARHRWMVVAASVPIRYGDFSQLTAKEQGQWYFHTFIGRWEIADGDSGKGAGSG